MAPSLIHSENYIEQKIIFDEEVQSFESSLHVQEEFLAIESFSPSFFPKETPYNIVPINAFSYVLVFSNQNEDTKEDDHDEITVLSIFTIRLYMNNI
jgi:hypothetical protein